MKQYGGATVSRSRKSCRRQAAKLQHLSKATSSYEFHRAFLFSLCCVQQKIRSRLLTEWWKKDKDYLTAFLLWQMFVILSPRISWPVVLSSTCCYYQQPKVLPTNQDWNREDCHFVSACWASTCVEYFNGQIFVLKTFSDNSQSQLPLQITLLCIN